MHETQLPQPTSPSPRLVSPWWRVLSIVLLLALLLAWAASATVFEQFKAHIQQLQHKVASVPQVHYLAVMLDAKQQPAMLLTVDRGAQALRLQRLNEVKEGREDSMQLWALSGDRAPRSLGVIESKFKTLELPASEADLADVSEVAISVEEKGGAAAGQGPRLPYLFRGGLVAKAL